MGLINRILIFAAIILTQQLHHFFNMKQHILLAYLLLLCLPPATAQNAPSAFGPTPNERQMKYFNEPLAGFIHFGMNTFTGTEWGNGLESPSSFNPTKGKANTDQWIRLFKEAGFKRVIITLKHHDGFCLWPTRQTAHNISASPYLNGQGDLAREISESCDKYGMDMGIYLSPWDIHEPSYGDVTPGDYNDFYAAQLEELLSGDYGRLNPATGKREIVEIWLDGATGSGVEKQTYDFKRYVELVRRLQPNCLTWMSTAAAQGYTGPGSGFPLDAFWVGNEAGYVNDPVWLKLNVAGNTVSTYSATGNYFSIPEADVSIRSGWFYHDASNGSVKSLEKLSEIYFRTVGMGIPLLLNVPPNKAGVFHPNDSTALTQLGQAVKNSFATNLLTPSMQASATATRGAGFEASKVLDGNYDSYWTMADGATTGSITIDLGKAQEIDIIRIREYIPLGQRISGFKVEVEVYGQWVHYGSGATIGFQRVIKGLLMPVSKIRFTVNSSLAVPLICSIEAFRSDASITQQGETPMGLQNIKAAQFQLIEPVKARKLRFEITAKNAANWPTLAEMRFYTRENGKLVELPRQGITATASSEAKNATSEPPSLAGNTIDNDNSTIWQPEWSPSKVNMPQHIEYDFGKEIELTDISYLPRQTSSGDVPTQFNIYLAAEAGSDFIKTLSGGSFLATTNEAQYTPVKGTDWTRVSTLPHAMRNGSAGAKATLAVDGGWFRLVGAKGPDAGMLSILLNGNELAAIDCYSPVARTDQVLYELNGLPASTQGVEIRVTGQKNAKSSNSFVTLQNAYTLSPNVNGMFEFGKPLYDIEEGTAYCTVEVKRSGTALVAASVTVSTSPGTGVHGKTYEDVSTTLEFEPGEFSKTVAVKIIDNDFKDGNKDFYLELSNPTQIHILNTVKTTRILVYDNDTESNNPQLEGYCIPTGSQRILFSKNYAWLETAYTTGADENLQFSAQEAPANVYLKTTDHPVVVRRGKSFQLFLNGYHAPELNILNQYNDFRLNKMYIMADWNANLQFETEELIADLGDATLNDKKTGNFSSVLDSVRVTIDVPSSALLQNIALRIYYHNHNSPFVSGCSSVSLGQVYDFRLKINDNRPTGLRLPQNEPQLNVFHAGNQLVCINNSGVRTRLSLINSSGLPAYRTVLDASQVETRINTDRFTTGIYIVHLKNQNETRSYKIYI